MLPDIAPEFVLRLNGQPHTGWTRMDVMRALDRMSGEFTVGMTQAVGDDVAFPPVAAGTSVQVEIGGALVLSGYVDTVEFSYDKITDDVVIKGRDKTGDLIDCAASVDGPFEFTNMKLDAIISKVIKPFGLSLKVEAPVGDAFKRLAIQPGETAFELIDRACRYRGVLCVSDGIGGLVIVKPSAEKSAGQIVYGENVLSGDAALDHKEMFSVYVIKGQAEAFSDETTAEETSKPEGRAVEQQIKRYRPKVIVGESQGYDMTQKQRAEWEAKIARARSKRASYSVQGWYADAAAKKLWKPNTIVRVKDDRRGLNREMLIVGVSFSRSNEGTITKLDLALPEAFDIPAQKEGGGKGATSLWAEDQ